MEEEKDETWEREESKKTQTQEWKVRRKVHRRKLYEKLEEERREELKNGRKDGRNV